MAPSRSSSATASVADPGTQVTFLTSPRIRPQIDEALESDTKRVQALDLSRVSALDATGLSMVAEVMDRHPHLDVWVASAEKTPALQGAGVPEDRIHIRGMGSCVFAMYWRPSRPTIRRNWPPFQQKPNNKRTRPGGRVHLTNTDLIGCDFRGRDRSSWQLSLKCPRRSVRTGPGRARPRQPASSTS